jgi:2-methylcitrate dehydratase PrpD
MQRTTLTLIHDEDPDVSMHSTFDPVTATLHDGRQLRSSAVAHPAGHFRRTASGEQLWQKFRQCTAARLTSDVAQQIVAQQIFEMLYSLLTLSGPRMLISLLALGNHGD